MHSHGTLRLRSFEMGSAYHVLSHELPGYHAENMLGRVVLDVKDPLHRYIPDSTNGEAEFHPKAIVPDISDEGVPINDLSEFLDSVTDSKVKLNLDHILYGHGLKNNSRNTKMTAAIATRYVMNNVENKFNTLMRDKKYRKQVLELFDGSEGKPLALVTGVMTCEDMRVRSDRRAEHEVGADLRVPVGEAMGGPSLADPEAGFDYLKAYGNATESKIKVEVVFALAYDEILPNQYAKKKGWRKFLPKKQEINPVVGGKIPGTGPGLYLGASSDDDEKTDDGGEE